MKQAKIMPLEKPAGNPAPKFEFLPIQPVQLGRVWPLVAPGVAECLEGGRGEASPESVLRDLATGGKLLWLGLSGEKLVGFAVTQVVPGNFWSELLLYLVWIAPHAGGDFLKDGLPTFEEYGRSVGCKRVVFYSAREKTRSGKAFSRRVEEIGFKPHYVEYVKEI
ncbi:MAG: hypothetical protein AB1405_07785 [Bdellovibrionota bacterium]